MNNINILSLDPMYSSLHDNIADFFSGEKYALLSSQAMAIYLRKYKKIIIAKNLNNYPSNEFIDLVQNNKNHYRSLLNYNLNRDLNNFELEYMSKFASYFYHFIKDKNIGLVILHNDLRWHHSLAIEICKILEVKYLVTEQGLFRPYTTVIDPIGVNANSSIMNINENEYIKIETIIKKHKKVKNDHNSSISKLFFLLFLICFKLEKFSNTRLYYQHNNFSIKKYFSRFIKQLKKGSYNEKSHEEINIKNKYLFIPLQLENDTQILIHSRIKSNQLLITEIEKNTPNDIKIYFKKHPNDFKNYILGEKSKFIDGNISTLAKNAYACITINSSAAIDIIKTNSPLFLFGDSIYNHSGIAQKITIDELRDYLMSPRENLVDLNKRKKFIKYLLNDYSVYGAGFSYDKNEIKRILKKYNILE